MTNDYDTTNPRDLDVSPNYHAALGRNTEPQEGYMTFRPLQQPPPAIKGQLVLALQTAIQEAQHLANYYDGVAKQLSLLASQVEHTK